MKEDKSCKETRTVTEEKNGSVGPLPPLTNAQDKADEPISYRCASEGDIALDIPGVVQNVYIRSESRKDSPRGTTGSRPPSGVPRATLLSFKRRTAADWLLLNAKYVSETERVNKIKCHSIELRYIFMNLSV
ncbi:hypothetical protein TNCV_4341151 [Trichonephila clavipes]|nr:hypothetical protein TNCV_4341151 [Trichonephila clavipes]